MIEDVIAYNLNQIPEEKEICDTLYSIISQELKKADIKIWHKHPVWFLNENPIVGYSKQKNGIRLMFWSGMDFNEKDLEIIGKKFKDASIFYKNVSEIKTADLKRWLKKSKTIQWDYKNIVKRKGVLERIK